MFFSLLQPRQQSLGPIVSLGKIWRWESLVTRAELPCFGEFSVRDRGGIIQAAVLGELGPTALASRKIDRDKSLDQIRSTEREHILRVLRETGGVVSTAATRLKMPRTTLNAMMRKLGISRKKI